MLIVGTLNQFWKLIIIKPKCYQSIANARVERYIWSTWSINRRILEQAASNNKPWSLSKKCEMQPFATNYADKKRHNWHTKCNW